MKSSQQDPSPWAVGPILKNPATSEPRSPATTTRRSGGLVAAPAPRNRVVTARTTTPCPAATTFTWVGAHGGAGATSLAAGSGRGTDLTGVWPDPALGWPTAVVLVCRTNAAGLTAAGRMLQEWASRAVPDLDVVALVAVADAPGKLPRTLARRLAEIQTAVPHLLTAPWVPTWREHPYVADPAAATIAAQVERLVAAAIRPSRIPPSRLQEG
ncbi:DUF6668 family protein [Solicola sp. PLA-1-18]|uniref:DUF6668 family protein n=1 Tax=Solicola sp. PLA-1-18 TaxID=3380532 RepID=UPI003B7CD381